MADNKGFLYKTLDAIEEHIFGTMVGMGVLIFGGYAVGNCVGDLSSAYQTARSQAGLELKVGDYNGNQLLDKYYEINGLKVPVEVDGKSVAEYFNK